MDDDGVSPVIGVILMVAITVVLAAVVYVLVGSFQQENEADPIRFTGKVDEARDEWDVVRGPAAGVLQSDLQWRGGAGVRYAFDAPVSAASPLVPTEWIAFGGDDPLDGGSVVRFCADGLAVQPWSFSFRTAETHSLLSTYRFSVVAPCV